MIGAMGGQVTGLKEGVIAIKDLLEKYPRAGDADDRFLLTFPGTGTFV